MTDTLQAPRAWAPGVPYIKFDPAGAPYIEGHRCPACQAAFTFAPMACPRCASRQPMQPFRSQGRGTLHTFTVVSRSYPGIAVPFVSAIVDLDDGLVLKGNLTGVEPDPAAIPFGLPVEVYFDAANGQAAKDGTPYITYFFRPAAREPGQ